MLLKMLNNKGMNYLKTIKMLCKVFLPKKTIKYINKFIDVTYHNSLFIYFLIHDNYRFFIK
jgi:hypothetical protein